MQPPISLRSLWLLTSLAPAALANNFIFPAPTSGQDFHDGDTIDVSWTTSYTQAHLQLYCHYLTNPLINISIPARTNVHPLLLDVGPQPNCYLQLSQGGASFGTGIFSISAPNGTVSTWGQQGYMVANGTAPNCNCQCVA